MGDGFDHYTDLTLKWDTVFGDDVYQVPPYIYPTAGRNGTPGLVLPACSSNMQSYLAKNLPTQATYVVGGAVCVPSGQSPTGPAALFSILDPVSGGQHVAICVTPDGHLLLVSGMTQGYGTSYVTRAVSSGRMVFNSPQYIEFKATIDPASGAASVKINGVTVLTFSGNTTNGQGFPNLIGGFLLGKKVGGNGYANVSPSTGLTFNVDDIYICDTTGTYNKDFLGDVRAAYLKPTGAGTYTDLTGTVGAWSASTPVNLGYQIQDSNGNIQEVTAIVGTPFNGTLGTWTANTYYPGGSLILDSNGNIQFANANFSNRYSGSTVPTWNTHAGSATSDNYMQWDNLGPAALTKSGLHPTWDPTPGNTTTDNNVTWTNIGTTAPWMLVAESRPDGDESYISTPTINDKSTFTVEPLPTVVGSVVAVQVSTAMRKGDGGPSIYHALTRSAATDAESGDQYPSTAHSILTPAFEVDPATASPWTLSAVNAAEFGGKKIS